MTFPSSVSTFQRPIAGVARNSAPTEVTSFSTLMNITESIQGMLVGPTHYNVKDPTYGATGDGVTDDTTAMQAAMDAASTAAAQLWVPTGTYIVDGLRAKSNVLMRLAPGATLQLKASAAQSAALLGPSSGSLTNFTLEGGTIDGNYTNQVTNRDGIQIVPATTMSRVSIRYVKVTNAYRHGIFLSEGGGGSDGAKEIVGCEIDGHGQGAVGYGIYVDYAPGAVITRNTLRNAGNNSDQIELGNGGKYICTHNTCVDSQLQFPFASDSVIAFNKLLGTRSVIQNDSNTAHRVRVIGNYIAGATPDSAVFAGISITGDDAVVLGNEVNVNTYRGVRVNGTRAVIEANRVGTASTSGVGAGIYPENGQYSRVVGNTLIGNWLQGVVIDSSDIAVGFNYIESSTATGTCIYLVNSADSGRTYDRLSIAFNDCAVGATKIDRQNQHNATVRLFGNSNYQTDQVDVILSSNLPAAATSNDGRILIESAGFGDQNLIIYSQGGRYRLDGGTTF